MNNFLYQFINFTQTYTFTSIASVSTKLDMKIKICKFLFALRAEWKE